MSWQKSYQSYKGWKQGANWNHGTAYWSQGDAGAGGWWGCDHAACKEACKKRGVKGAWLNPPSACQCKACGTARPAQAKKLSLLDGVKADLAGASGKTYAQTVAGGAPTIAVTVAPATEEDVMSESEGEPAKIVTEIALTQEYVALARLLPLPAALTAEWTADTAAAKFLPKKARADVEKVEADLKDAVTTLDVQTRGLWAVSATVLAASSKKVTALTKTLEDNQAESTATLAACELEVSLQQHDNAEKAKVGRALAAEEAARQNADRLEDICSEQQQAWEAQLWQLQQERLTREAAWLARRTLYEDRHFQAQQLLQTKLDEAKLRTGQSTAPAAQSFSLQVADAKAEVVKVKKEAADALKLAAEERKQLLDRLEALEKATAAVAPTASADPAAARLADEICERCHLTVVYEDSDLPVLTAPPDKDACRHMSLLSSNLTYWGQMGMSPLTFGQLLAGTPDGQVDAAFLFVRNVAGEQIWARFFGGSTCFTEEYVPYQLGTILNASLHRADAILKKCNKQHDVAQTSKAYFLEHRKTNDEAKRQRSGPYAA